MNQTMIQNETQTQTAQPQSRAETETKLQRAEARRATPPMDVFESADEFVLVFDVPGVSSENVELDIEKGTLTLVARREIGDEYMLEYRRAVGVSDAIDPSGVSAKLEHGVLTVQLQKRPELKARRIQVQGA